MSWNFTLGIVALIALSIPIILMIVLRLATHRSFPFLLASFIFSFLYNLFNLGYFNVPDNVINNMNFWNNILDAPLMIMFLTYFSPSVGFSKRMRMGVIGLIAFQAIIIALFGYNTKAMTIILGPGLAATTLLCLYFFIRHTKITIMHRKASGKAIMAASLVFAYGCYSLIYLLYYVLRTPHVADTFLVYFLSVIFSSLLLSAGIFIEKRRVQKLNELKIARKELSLIYNEPARTTPLRSAAMLDFDKEKWN